MLASTPVSKASTSHFPSLTGLRFYAALLVFISHLYLLNYLVGLPESSLLYDAINKLGQLGVGLFFVLSGFVLFVNYPLSRKWSVNDFYLARFARVYPVFLLTTLIALPIDLLSPDGKAVIPSLLAHLGLIHCFHLSTCGTLNSPSWSISSEFIFYLLFPLFTSLFLTQAIRNVTLVLLAFLVLLLPFKFLIPQNFYVSPIFPLTRIAEFLLGMTVAWFYLKYQTHPIIACWMSQLHSKRITLAWVLLLSLLMVLQPLLLAPYPFLKSLYFLLYAIPSALIILTLALMDRYGLSWAVLATPLAILGGEISYSFYLIHHLLLRYAFHFFNIVFHIDLRQASTGLLTGVTVLIFLASILSAYWLYHRVEIPWKKRILDWYRKPRPILLKNTLEAAG